MRIIAGELRGRRLVAEPAPRTRPTTDLVRGALFNILAARLPGSSFLDLFAGTGAVGLEAASRGADSVTWIENNRLALRGLRQNVTTLAPDLLPGVLCIAVKDFLEKPATYDIIFADPPYDDGVAALLDQVVPRLPPNGIFVLEHRTRTKPVPPVGLVVKFTKSYGDSSLTGFEPAQQPSVG